MKDELIRELLVDYAHAANWYLYASDRELSEHGETREDALQRCAKINLRLTRMGHEFTPPPRMERTAKLRYNTTMLDAMPQF